MDALKPKSRLSSLALAVVLGAQIWMSVVVFRKWDTDMYDSDKIDGSASSDYKDDDGHWRGTWEMQGLLSNIGKGSQFPGYRAKVVVADSTTAFNIDIVNGANDMRLPAYDVSYGGGGCTVATDCNAGACTGSVCVCDPLCRTATSVNPR